MTDNLILLARFYDPHAAHITRGVLETYDIPCFVMDDHVANTAFYLQQAIGGIRLMVTSVHYEEARQILEENLQKSNCDSTALQPLISRERFGLTRMIASLLLTGIFGIPLPLKSRKKP
jgi:hypothetical protein